MNPLFNHLQVKIQKILPFMALGLLFFVLGHSAWQTTSAILAGKTLQEAVPVLEKPIAEFGKFIGASLTAWMPELLVNTPFGTLSIKGTVSYTLYEWVKLPILLFLTTFGMTLLRLKLGAKGVERTLGRDDFWGAVGGAITGMLTPVCSCTVTNLYAGLVAGGASRKASSAFLFASPALNEFAILFMFIFGGWLGGLMYLTTGFLAAILTAYLAPWLGLSPQNFVNKISGLACHYDHRPHASLVTRAFQDAQNLSKRLLFPILFSGLLAGILVNFNLTLIAVMKIVGFHWWGPIVATLVGLPLDINAASTAPILMALSGILPLGTLVSVIMATTVASIPEVTMLIRLVGKSSTGKVIFWYASYTIFIGLLLNLIFV